jgi:hypothetical protein
MGHFTGLLRSTKLAGSIYTIFGPSCFLSHGGSYAIDAPKLRGGTGLGEIGLSLKPSPALPLSLDIGVQGYTGKREGVTGALQVKWEF